METITKIKLFKLHVTMMEIQREYNNNNGLILPTESKCTDMFTILETNNGKLVMKDSLIIDELVKQLVKITLNMEVNYSYWFHGKRLGEIIRNLFPQELHDIMIVMPWLQVDSTNVLTNFFNVNTTPLVNMQIDQELTYLGFIPTGYDKWLINTFKTPSIRVNKILSKFSIKMAKIRHIKKYVKN